MNNNELWETGQRVVTPATTPTPCRRRLPAPGRQKKYDRNTVVSYSRENSLKHYKIKRLKLQGWVADERRLKSNITPEICSLQLRPDQLKKTTEGQ